MKEAQTTRTQVGVSKLFELSILYLHQVGTQVPMSTLINQGVIVSRKTLESSQLLKSIWHVAVVAALQSLSRVQLFATPWAAARKASLSYTVSQSLLRFMSIESVMPSNHLILSHPFPFLA